MLEFNIAKYIMGFFQKIPTNPMSLLTDIRQRYVELIFFHLSRTYLNQDVCHCISGIQTPEFICVKSCGLRWGVMRKEASYVEGLHAIIAPDSWLGFGQNLGLRESIVWSTKVESKDQFDLINNFDCLFMHCIDLRITPVS